MTDFIPGQTGQSRVWFIEGGARPDHAPSFQGCMAAGALSASFGDVERIECPSAERFNEFVEKGTNQGAVERPTMDIVGRFPLDVVSTMLALARRRCAFDVHVNMGDCESPTDFDAFKKKVIIENAKFTSWETDELGTLESDGAAPVNETGSLSGSSVYEIVPVTAARRGDDVITNELLDVVICDAISCGDCDDESTGCQVIFAISSAAGGSPGTPPDIVYSRDGGVNVYAHDIDTLATAENPSAVVCHGAYVVVFSNDSCSLHYVEDANIQTYLDPVWTEVAVGFVATGCPNDADSTGSFTVAVGDNGYIYTTDDPTSGVAVADAGVATTANLNAVKMLNEDFIIAVGDSGAIVKAEDGATFAVVTPDSSPVNPIGVNFNSLDVKNKDVWIVGTTAGALWYTVDGGQVFTAITNLPGTPTAIRDIDRSTDGELWVSYDIAGPRGRIARSYNDGNTWRLVSEATSTIPLNDRITAIAACQAVTGENFMVGVGLADDGTDGIWLNVEA